LKISNIDEVDQTEFHLKGASGVKIQYLIPESIAKTFMMRRFTIKEGGYTPLHKHDFEHEVFVLGGKGVVCDGKKEYQLSENSFILVYPNDIHQFLNKGKEDLVLLCMIPKKEHTN
jgi:quercetin dioxygenase-like cupin family protein